MGIKLWQRGGVAALAILMAGAVWAARESNVRATKHNFSSATDLSAVPVRGGTVPARTVKATSETQVCVFCHTPHAATSGATPLWNRKLSNATYTPYSSNSLDAKTIEGTLAQPGGSSKLCLSCHDGTLAIGNVNVLNGTGSGTTPGTVSISMQGGVTVMPSGSGTTTGFTRFLDADLGNDHPISVTYNPTLTARDGELRTPTLNPVENTYEWVSGGNRILGVRNFSGTQPKPVLPLEKTGSASDAGQIQCATCHDPHIRETNEATVGNQKFLRLNRFQEVAPADAYNKDNDIVCLACHDKNTGTGAWAFSAHANPQVATQTYLAAASTQREFPANLPVWKAACLNCHDTHSIPGSRRLLREGTDSSATPKAGGSSAIEETCYQCHVPGASSIITPTTTVPDIKTDFNTAGNKRMPITSVDQAALSEMHDIGGNFNDSAAGGAGAACDSPTNKCGKDFIEKRSILGAGSLSNRHAECTDCHNPHRVIKNRNGLPGALASGNTQETAGTHPHTDNNAAIHANTISGVLRGAWGVEPIYSSPSFHSLPSGYTVKRGDPGSSTDTTAGATHVTREYQICLKCHSDYAYSDDNAYPNSSSRPQLGGTGLTAQNANGHSSFTSYTNQAKEFQAPTAHAVAVGSVSLGNNGGTGTAGSNSNNHRSWHPVMAPTGRTGRSGSWIAPWNNSGTGGKAGRLGVQTMYCSDCHGSSTGTTASVIPTGGEDGSPWGPHGSSNNFLLKGVWDTTSGEGSSNTLCFKCHSSSAYSGGGGTGWSTDKGDGHNVHSTRISGKDLRCNWCHIAVPHGWKNRNLLVNLLDVGAEAGLAAGTAVAYTKNVGYTNGPYYRKAFLRIISFPSGQWTTSNCNGGSKDGMTNTCDGPN